MIHSTGSIVGKKEKKTRERERGIGEKNRGRTEESGTIQKARSDQMRKKKTLSMLDFVAVCFLINLRWFSERDTYNRSSLNQIRY